MPSTPEAGAECVNAHARICAAGRWATSAPTATVPSNGDPYRDSMVELCSHSATERAGMETLHLRMRAPVPHPTLELSEFQHPARFLSCCRCTLANAVRLLSPPLEKLRWLQDHPPGGLRAAAWDFIRCVEPELCSDGIAPPPWSIALLAPDSGGCSAESRQCPWFHRVREVGAVVSEVPGLVFRQWRMEPVVSQFQALIGTGPWHRDARGGRGCRRLPVGASWPAKGPSTNYRIGIWRILVHLSELARQAATDPRHDRQLVRRHYGQHRP